MDYCTTCKAGPSPCIQGKGCPDEESAPRDERPGSQVGTGLIQSRVGSYRPDIQARFPFQVGHIKWNDPGNETKTVPKTDRLLWVDSCLSKLEDAPTSTKCPVDLEIRRGP